MGWYYRDYFPRSTPRQAKGGIKAQSKRGQFGQSWWAKRWLAVLEGFQIVALPRKEARKAESWAPWPKKTRASG